jgi:hypothetical protein
VILGEQVPEPFSIEVVLTSLYQPGKPLPINLPDFSAFEGKKRYLRLFRDGDGNPITDCLDSAAFQTTFKCATLGCEPEVVDWVELFGNEMLFVTGDAVIPDSVYNLRTGNVNTPSVCELDYIQISTARWGDTDASGVVNVTDVVTAVNRVKDVFNAVSETAALLHPASPTPHTSSPSVLDITLTVDAIRLVPYPYGISTCP